MSPRRSFGYANVMSTLAALLALTALVTGTAISKNSNDSGGVPANSVGTKQVKPNALGPQDLGANSVTSSEVANGSITSGTVAPGAIQTDDLATGSVTSGTVGPDAILSQNLAPNSITAPALAPNSVTPGAVRDSSYKALTLVNGWHGFAGYYQPGYTVEPDGLVRLRGAIVGGSDVQFASLPAAVRPTAILQTAIYASCPDANTDGLYIEGPMNVNAGKMYVSRTDCGIYSLDGVTFQP